MSAVTAKVNDEDSNNDGSDRHPCNSTTEFGLTETLSISQTLHEKLAISDAESTTGTSTPSAKCSLSPPIRTSFQSDIGSKTRTIICDLWYGLPVQKRPRRERVNAVARQLRNFECWSSSTNKCASRGTTSRSRSRSSNYRIVLVGGEADVKVVGTRLGKLRLEEKADDSDECRIELLPGVTVEEEFSALGQSTTSDNVEEKSVVSTTDGISQHQQEARYLSPDAEHILSPCQIPPQTVVVGMLIDRRVQPNRSNQRATKINVNATRLPMDELRVDGLENSEALNVDTVLELMVRWWDAVDGIDESTDWRNGRDDSVYGDSSLRRCFLDAASSAMASHEERHPNRALHGTIS